MFADKNNKYKDVLHFIDIYRSHEVLWNMNISSYRRNDLKLKAYNSIAAETKMPVEDVKKKIKSLRTAYSAEKSRVERSKKSGCDTDSIYIPSVFWYNEMSFLDVSLIRRKTVDNSKQEDTLAEASIDSETNDSFIESQPSCSKKRKQSLEAKVKFDDALDSETNDSSFVESYPSSSKKRRHSPEAKSKLDDALEKLIAINKDVSVFESFGESVGRQIKEFPEVEAYQLMADMQSMISKRKMQILKRNEAPKTTQIVPVEVNRTSRASTPKTDTDILFFPMSDVEFLEEEC